MLRKSGAALMKLRRPRATTGRPPGENAVPARAFRAMDALMRGDFADAEHCGITPDRLTHFQKRSRRGEVAAAKAAIESGLLPGINAASIKDAASRLAERLRAWRSSPAAAEREEALTVYMVARGKLGVQNLADVRLGAWGDASRLETVADAVLAPAATPPAAISVVGAAARTAALRCNFGEFLVIWRALRLTER